MFQRRRWAPFLLAAVLLLAACTTHLGYAPQEFRDLPKPRLLKAGEPKAMDFAILQMPGDSQSDPTMHIRVVEMVEQEWVIETTVRENRVYKHAPFDLWGKTLEFVSIPFHWTLGPVLALFLEGPAGLTEFPLLDLTVKLFGGQGFHGVIQAYEDHPPGYFTRLNHNLATGLLNPAILVLYWDTNKVYETKGEAVVTDTERKTEKRLGARPVPNQEIRVSTQRVPAAVLKAETDAEGVAVVSLDKWFDLLPVGKEIGLEVAAVGATLPGGRDSVEGVLRVVSTNALLPLEIRQKRAWEALLAVRPAFQEAEQEARRRGAAANAAEEFAACQQEWSHLQSRIESLGPPSAEDVTSEALRLAERMNILAGGVVEIYGRDTGPPRPRRSPRAMALPPPPSRRQ